MIFLLENIKKSLAQKYNWLQWSVPPPNILARKGICCSSSRELSFENGILKCSPKLQLCHKYDRFKLQQLRNYIHEKLQGYDLFALAHKDLISWVKYPEHSSCVKIIVRRMLREIFLVVISQSFHVFFERNAFRGVQVQSCCGGPGVSTLLGKRCRKAKEASDHWRGGPSASSYLRPHVLRIPHRFLVKAAQITTGKNDIFPGEFGRD